MVSINIAFVWHSRSGNVYEGMWSNNVRHGNGTMHWYDKGEKYTGDWMNGVQSGNGEHIWMIKNTDNAQVSRID